jgi:peptidoglycan/xylan/chitin deacetylase (PgdA/CDA1 family)
MHKHSLRNLYVKLSPFMAACLYYSGLVAFARLWARRSGARLVILNYHRAAGGDLRRHLLYLRRHYRILPLETALEELYAPSKGRRPQSSDSRIPLAITFDDGYHDNYTHAHALACELQIPITVFLPPGYMESGRRFLWLEGEWLVQHARVDEATIAGRTYRLDHLEEREALAQAIDAHARFARSVADREIFLAGVRNALAAPLGASSEERPSWPLTWRDIHEMEIGGWVTFGAHTMHHPILACLADPAEVEYEVKESREVLEQRLGHPVRTFAYPYGGPRDIGQHALNAIQEAGFSWGVTTTPGFNTPDTDPHRLRRMPTDVSESWLMLAAEASGIWWWLLGFVMRLLGMPTDTGALPYSPLFRYRAGKLPHQPLVSQAGHGQEQEELPLAQRSIR